MCMDCLLNSPENISFFVVVIVVLKGIILQPIVMGFSSGSSDSEPETEEPNSGSLSCLPGEARSMALEVKEQGYRGQGH